MTVDDILRSTVTLDDAGVTQKLRGGEVIHISWNDLTEMSVTTTDSGPFVEDVYFNLLGRDGRRCVVPQASPVTDQLVRKLLQLPGFDSAAFGRAMCSTDHATFLCWRRPDSP